mgnify:CR=1 FL=1|jgi:hypothetical protein
MDSDALLRLFGYTAANLSGNERARALPVVRGVAAE